MTSAKYLRRTTFEINIDKFTTTYIGDNFKLPWNHHFIVYYQNQSTFIIIFNDVLSLSLIIENSIGFGRTLEIAI